MVVINYNIMTDELDWEGGALNNELCGKLNDIYGQILGKLKTWLQASINKTHYF